MNRLFALVLALNGGLLLPAAGAEYEGTVGKMKAVFSLDWKEDGSVSGAYSYPARPGTTYTLRGRNDAEGELYLEEFTGNKLTARCYLGKVITDGAILWRGEMRNSDGRVFAMEFSRRREAAAPAPDLPEATRYTGSVGRLTATFALTWHEGGAVTGTYTYPDRPGTTYSLEGVNPREGELYLAEYNGEELTARCQLWKRVEAGEILWEGEMRNLDGRRFPMVLSRSRESTSATAAVGMATYESERAAIRAAIRPTYRWNQFPFADEVVEMVPVDFPGAQHFNARITGFRSGADGLVLSFVVGEWDGQDRINYEGGPEVVLEMARTLPLDPAVLVGNSSSAVFAGDGSLLSVELCGIAVTHARKATGGKLEVRGLIETWNDRETKDWDPERFRLEMRKAPVLEFLPDKLALDLHPEFASDEVFFQVIRLVKEYGISIQSTDAGPGSLELESLSLDAEPENPWIPLDATSPGITAPPTQQTGQAG